MLLVGWLAYAVGGVRAAYVAAAITAANPALIAADGSLMSETLFVPLTVAAILVTVYAARRRTWWLWLGLGLLLGLATLARQDGLVLALVLVVPLVFLVAGDGRARTARLFAVLAGIVVVVGPWVVRNDVRMGVPTITTASAATALAGANCDETYHGREIGLWDYRCTRGERRAFESEKEYSSHLQRDTGEYVLGHLSTVPKVLVARFVRGLGLWAPRQQATQEEIETRVWGVLLVTYFVSFVLLAVGGFGIVRRSPDAVTRWILAAPVATSLLLIVVGHANTRFRAIAEPELAVGVGLLAAGFRRKRDARPARRELDQPFDAAATPPPPVSQNSGATPSDRV